MVLKLMSVIKLLMLFDTSPSLINVSLCFQWRRHYIVLSCMVAEGIPVKLTLLLSSLSVRMASGVHCRDHHSQ